MKNLIAFGYYGGKNSKLNFILPQLNTPHRKYVELCGGSAAVLLNKPQVEVEVLNDLSGELITFWKVLREQPDALIRQIKLSPPGEAEFKRILSLPPTDDDVENARRFFMRVTQTYACIPSGVNQMFYGGSCVLKKRANLDLVAERIRDVIVENSDAVRLINRVETTIQSLRRTPVLFYADPPYVDETRESLDIYIHDAFDHEKFLDAVLNAPETCKFAISGYNNDLYNNALADWHRVEIDVPLKAGNFGEKRTEVLWRNYPLTATARFL